MKQVFDMGDGKTKSIKKPDKSVKEPDKLNPSTKYGGFNSSGTPCPTTKKQAEANKDKKISYRKIMLEEIDKLLKEIKSGYITGQKPGSRREGNKK